MKTYPITNARLYIDGAPDGLPITHLELPTIEQEGEWSPHTGPLAFDLSAVFNVDMTDLALDMIFGERACQVCGCTERHACVDEDLGPCWWVGETLCSHCAPKPKGFGRWRRWQRRRALLVAQRVGRR